MASDKRSHRRLKICCGVSALVLVILLVVLVVLFFTVFKPKNPEVTVKPVSLEGFDFQLRPFNLNATLGILIMIKNRNYGSFKYQNTTIYAYYRDTVIAKGPIVQDTIPSHGTHDISTSLHITADKLLSTNLLPEILAGSLYFTSSTEMRGKVTVFMILKLPAKVYCTCEISVFVRPSLSVVSKCSSEFKK